MMKLDVISHDEICHAAWTRDLDEVNDDIPLGLCAVRYYRFHRKVNISLIKIFPMEIRWAPVVVGQPAHVIIQSYDILNKAWKTVADVNLPYFDDSGFHCIEVDDVITDNLRLICDKEHMVEPSHGEQWSNPSIVPFKILDKIEFQGIPHESEEEPIYNKPLDRGGINLGVIDGVEVVKEPHEISFKSPYFAVSFSLRRPMITHLGWDDMGQGLSKDNLVPVNSVWLQTDNVSSFCGPILRTLSQDITPQFWGGTVEVNGNKVIYKDLRAVDNYSLIVEFEVYEKGMNIEFIKECSEDIPAIEGDDWRFVWNLTKSITGTIGMPTGMKGRTGTVVLPAMWNSPGHGTVLITQTKGAPDLQLQVDSWRENKLGWAGFTLGASRGRYGELILKKGKHSASVSLEVRPILPKFKSKIKDITQAKGVLRNWSSIFTFRPEIAGFSNNSTSCNCHLSQYHIADILPYVKEEKDLPSLVNLMRYTVELSLKGGPGYGDRRDLYMDSDPSILIALGRIHQLKPDKDWIQKMWPFIRKAVNRGLDNMGEEGLLKCSYLTGNSGSKKWSSNGWDVVSFGNYDGYSNLLGYRALRNMISIAKVNNDTKLCNACIDGAASIKNKFSDCFYNEENGWLGGWRSADGELHDYAFTFINYMAICYGLVEEETAVKNNKKP